MSITTSEEWTEPASEPSEEWTEPVLNHLKNGLVIMTTLLIDYICDLDNDGAIGSEDCDTRDATLHPFDVDQDGFSGCDGDCDDSDETIHPEAVDSWYDGVDQNCDDANDYRSR